MYALNLDENNRILSICVVLPSTPVDLPRVDTLPEGDCNDYLYVNGEYVYDPVPTPPEPIPEETDTDLLLEIAADHEFRISELELFGGM